ncbi:MAG: hypothetical protein Q9183_005623, partial [Haloplaca sp. 2 TL-2023]
VSVNYFANNRTLVICYGAFSLSVHVDTNFDLEGGSHKRQDISVIDLIEEALHMLQDWAHRGLIVLGQVVITVGRVSVVVSIFNVMTLMLDRMPEGCLMPKLQLING